MGVQQDRLTTFAQFLGFNNLSDEYALPANTLRDAINLDFTREGKLKSRAGYGAPVVACENGHSLWGHDLFPVGLFVDQDTLFAFNPDQSADVIATGLSLGLPVSYARINDAVYWSNGVQCGMVNSALEPLAWACANPIGQPDLAEHPNGSIGVGLVQVAITYVDTMGRESGSTLAASITVAPDRGVTVSNIPQPVDTLATPLIRIYATAGNDQVLYLAQQIPAGVTSYTILGKPQGKPLNTQFLTPLPPGQVVRYWNARQLVARDRFLVWSPSFRYGMTHLGHMNIGFPSRIELMEPVGDGEAAAGVYVAAGHRTYYLAGPDPNGWSQKVVYGYGAVEGTACMVPAEALGLGTKQLLPAWLARSGLFLVGLPGGQVVSYKDNEAIAQIGQTGASIFRQAKGLNQVVTAIRGGALPRPAVTDRAIARVYDEEGNLKP